MKFMHKHCMYSSLLMLAKKFEICKMYTNNTNNNHHIGISAGEDTILCSIWQYGFGLDGLWRAPRLCPLHWCISFSIINRMHLITVCWLAVAI